MFLPGSFSHFRTLRVIITADMVLVSDRSTSGVALCETIQAINGRRACARVESGSVWSLVRKVHWWETNRLFVSTRRRPWSIFLPAIRVSTPQYSRFPARAAACHSRGSEAPAALERPRSSLVGRNGNDEKFKRTRAEDVSPQKLEYPVGAVALTERTLTG